MSDLTVMGATELQPNAFDYSGLQIQVSDKLQKHASNIIQHRIRSLFLLGKELKEAQDTLADHDSGIFGKWYQSLGYNKDTVYRHINAYDFVVENCENPDDAEKIQQSLLFAISKPSAPKELTAKVLEGDITTHKEYKELLEKYNKVNQEAINAKKDINNLTNELIKTKMDMEDEVKKWNDLVKQTESSLQVAEDDEEVERLKAELEEAEKAIIESKEKIGKLEQQIKEQPIEGVVANKIPDGIEKELEELRALRDGKQKSEAEQTFKFVFNSFVESFKKVLGEIENLEVDMKEKYKDALASAIDKMKARL